MNEVMRVIKQYHCHVKKQESQLFCDMQIEIPLKTENECTRAFGEIRSLQVHKIPAEG
jgi:hypothetical protein